MGLANRINLWRYKLAHWIAPKGYHQILFDPSDSDQIKIVEPILAIYSNLCRVHRELNHVNQFKNELH